MKRSSLRIAREAAQPQLGAIPGGVFQSERLGMRISLPRGWEAREGVPPIILAARSGQKLLTISALPAVGHPETSQALSEEEIQGYWAGMIRELQATSSDVRPSGQGSMTVGGVPARFLWLRRPARSDEGSGVVVGYNVLAFHGGAYVRFALSAPQAEYRAARQAFDACVKSLTWTR